MAFTLFSYQIAPLQGSTATSSLPQSTNKGIKDHICETQLETFYIPGNFCKKSYILLKNGRLYDN